MRHIKTASGLLLAWALSLGLGLAILGMGIGLAHAEKQLTQQQIGSSLVPTSANEFTCHAQPGGWCDLRDWSIPMARPTSDQ